jgi:hypothetical protein
MNLPDPEAIKKRLRELAPSIFKEFPVSFAYLHGSYASGQIHPFSDLDIAVYAKGVLPENLLELELSVAIEIDEKLDFRAKSDVREITRLPLDLKGKIVSDGILIYSKDEISRVDFETAVRMAYFDFIQVISNYERIYFGGARPKLRPSRS